MNEHAPTAERPQLTGVDRVLKEVLYANVRFPQASCGIAGFTLNALFTDPDPQKIIREYLDTELSPEKIAMMIRMADRAHAAYLPKERIPVLEIADIQKLWKNEQKMVQVFLRFILEKGEVEPMGESARDEMKEHVLALLASEDLPVGTIKEVFEAFMMVFKTPEIQERLTEYRENYREYADSIDDVKKNTVVERGIQNDIIAGIEAYLSRDGRTIFRSQRKVLKFMRELA